MTQTTDDTSKPQSTTTHFGYTKVDSAEKESLVRGVFDSVAGHYDLMNDAMSLGVHRLWKRHFLFLADIQPHWQILDLAAGSGDLSILAARTLQTGCVTVTDINETMLATAHKRILDAGALNQCNFALADACNLTYKEATFDMVMCGFGVRNMTDIPQALSSMLRVLKPGGSAWILEFSKVHNPLLAQLYDAYSLKVIPKLGRWLAQDEASYNYLVESIRMHPDQTQLLTMMEQSGFQSAQYTNFTGGIAAVHRGKKPY